MLDDFFIRALFAGIGVALVTGPLGCFVVWRRLSYFGDTLAHSALLGVTLAYSLEFNIALSVFIISALIALILINLQKRTNLPGDALLGLLAHSSLAVGLVVIGFLSFHHLCVHDRAYVRKLRVFAKLGHQTKLCTLYLLQHLLENQNNKHDHLSKQHDR